MSNISSTIITDPRPSESETAEMLRLMRDIHNQNSRLLERLDKLEREQGRRAAVIGFGGGMVGGGIVHFGIELIRAKFGG